YSLVLMSFLKPEEGLSVAVVAVGDGQERFGVGVGARDDVHADDFADAASSSGAGIGRCFHSADVATDHHRDQAGANFLHADESDVGCLDHGVGGFNHAHQTLGFNQP